MFRGRVVASSGWWLRNSKFGFADTANNADTRRPGRIRGGGGQRAPTGLASFGRAQIERGPGVALRGGRPPPPAGPRHPPFRACETRGRSTRDCGGAIAKPKRYLPPPPDLLLDTLTTTGRTSHTDDTMFTNNLPKSATEIYTSQLLLETGPSCETFHPSPTSIGLRARRLEIGPRARPRAPPPTTPSFHHHGSDYEGSQRALFQGDSMRHDGRWGSRCTYGQV